MKIPTIFFIFIIYNQLSYSQVLNEYTLETIIKTAEQRISNLSGKTLEYKYLGNFYRLELETFKGRKKGKKQPIGVYKCTNHENIYKIIFNQNTPKHYEWLCFDSTNYSIILGSIETIDDALPTGFMIHFKEENLSFYLEFNEVIYPNLVSFDIKNLHFIASLDAKSYPTNTIRLHNRNIISHSKILDTTSGKVESLKLINPQSMPKIKTSTDFDKIISYLSDYPYSYTFSGISECKYVEDVPLWLLSYPCKY